MKGKASKRWLSLFLAMVMLLAPAAAGNPFVKPVQADGGDSALLYAVERGNAGGIGGMVVELVCDVHNSEIYYTTDGTTPGTTHSGSTKRFAGSIGLTQSATVKAIAVKNGAPIAGATFEKTYTVTLDGIIPAGHPRVFFQADDVAALAARKDSPSGAFQVNYASGGFSSNWERITSNAVYSGNGALTSHNASLVGAIEANALMYAMDKTANLAQGQRAVELTMAYVGASGNTPGNDRQMNAMLIAFGRAYDWCFELFTADQLTTIRNKIYTIAKNTETKFPNSPEGQATYGQDAMSGHGREEGILYAQLLCGIAMYDEDTHNPKMFDAAYKRLIEDYIPAGAAFFGSATNMQGAGYAMRVAYDMIAIKLLEGIGQPNPYDADAMSDYFKRLTIYNRRPDGSVMNEGDNYWMYTYNRNWYWHFDRIYIALMATICDDPVLQEEANRTLISFQTTDEAILDYLLRNPNAGQTTGVDKNGVATTSALPLTAYWGGWFPSMTARTGWYNSRTIQPDADVVIATMQMPTYNVGNHQHQDIGSFQLYYKGMLAIDSGIYDDYGLAHDLDYHKRSIAHNTVTVYDPAETFFYYNTNQRINDGGQRLPNNWREMRTIDEMVDPSKGYEVSKVLGYDFGGGASPADAPLYSYLSGDLDLAYTSKVSAYKRSMVFLNLEQAGVVGDIPAAFIVYDTVSSSNEDFRKAWLLHSEEQPDIQGTRTTIERNPRPGGTAVVNGDVVNYDATNYSGQLVNDTLLPASHNIIPIGGPGHEFDVKGVNIVPTGKSQPEDRNSDTYGQWRIEIVPTVKNKTDEFLNVMQVMDIGDTALDTTSLTPVLGEVVGANIANIDVYFGKTTAPISHPITVEASADAEHLLITGLKQGVWKVNDVAYTVTEEAGTLYATVDGGEEYNITPDGVEVEPHILGYTLMNSLLVAGKIAGEIAVTGYNFGGAQLFFVDGDGFATEATITATDELGTAIKADIPTSLAAGVYKIRVTVGSQSADFAETITVVDGTIPADAGNLIKDGSFEQANGTNVWKVNRGGTVSFSSDDPKDGNVHAIFELPTATPDNRNGLTQDLKAALIESGSGTYELSGWVRARDIPKSTDLANFRLGLGLAVHATEAERNSDLGSNIFTLAATPYTYNAVAAVADTGWVYLTVTGFVDCSVLDAADPQTNAAIYTFNSFGTGNNRQAEMVYFDGLSLRKIVSAVDSVIASEELTEGDLAGKTVTVTGENFATGMGIQLVDYKTKALVSGNLNYTVVNATEITVELPADASWGAYKIAVIKSGDTAISKGAFHIFPETPVAIDADELLKDPGMESGTNTNWTGGHSSATKPSYDSRTGLFAMYLDNTAGVGWVGIGQSVQDVFDLYGSGDYVVSAWVKTLAAPKNAAHTLQIDHTTNERQYNNQGTGASAPNVWEEISYTATIFAYEPITDGGFNVNYGNEYLVDDASMKRVPHTVTGITSTNEIGTQITIAGTNLSNKSKVFFVPTTGPAIQADTVTYTTVPSGTQQVVSAVNAILPSSLIVGEEYTVRVVIGSNDAETGGLRADYATKITVLDAPAASAGAAFDEATHDFGTQTVGYAALTPQTFTITNTGGLALSNIALAITGSDYTLTQPAATSLAIGGSTSFTVVPQTGLKPASAGDSTGAHNATITMTADEGMITASLAVSMVSANTFSAAFSQNSYNITPQAEGYATPNAATVSIAATGTGGVDNVRIAVSGDTTAFDINWVPADVLGGLKGLEYGATGWYPATREYTVTPVTGLSAGTYTVTLNLSASKSVTATTTVSYTVTAGAPEALTGTLAITGDAKFGETLTATATGAQGDATATFVWKRGGVAIAGATSQTYVLTAADIGAAITAEMTAGNYTGTLASAATAAVAKADGPAAPAAPTVDSVTETTVTLAAIAGAEYAIDGSGTWQTSPVFTGLTADTSYSFVARVAETSTALASSAGAAVTAQTDASPVVTVTAIAVNSTGHETVYTVGDALDVTGLTILVTYSDSTSETINVTAGMVSGFDSSQPETAQVLTITHGGQTTSFAVDIEAAAVPTPTPTPTPAPVGPQPPAPIVVRPDATATPIPTPQPTQAPAAEDQDADVTVATPEGQPPVQNDDGSQTLPGGGEITTDDGTVITVPEGTVISDDGVITVGQGGATVVRPDSEDEIFVPEDVLIFPDAETPLGFIVVGLPHVDVDISDWFFDAVAYTYLNGIMSSTSTEQMQFSPNADTTRSMIVTMLHNLSGKPEADGHSFADIPSDVWFEDATVWAQSAGVVFGTEDGLFVPDMAITRQDLAVILVRYAAHIGAELPEIRANRPFADDADIADYARDAVEMLYCAGVISGKPGELFDPTSSATRAEVAIMLQKFMEATVK